MLDMGVRDAGETPDHNVRQVGPLIWDESGERSGLEVMFWGCPCL